MKRCCFIGLILFLTLAACHRSADTVYTPSHPELVAIDTLMQSRPDSALAMLLDEPMDDPYYQLLLSEALYKNDYAQANRAELLGAMAYFDSVGNAFLSARCHYMNGVGHYEVDSVVPACEQYLKALEIMEEHFDEKELTGHKAKFMALTYTHLCEVFSDQYLHEQAIYFGKRSLPYYYRYEAEPWHVSWVYKEIGSHYFMSERLDSANYYYSKALESLSDTNNLIYRDIAALRAFLSFIEGNNSINSIRRLHHLLSLSESEDEIIARQQLIGEIYYQNGTWDSAWHYLNIVFAEIQNNNFNDSKVLSAQHLRDICLKNNDSVALSSYTLFLSKHANTSDLQAFMHSQLASLFHGFEKNREVRLNKQQQGRIVKKSGLIISSLIIITVMLIVFYTKNKKRHREIQAQNESLEQQLENETRSHLIQQTALRGRLRHSNQTLRDTSLQLEILKTESRAIPNKSETIDFEAFKGCPICSHILGLVEKWNFKPKTECSIYKTIALDRKQLNSLIESADLFLASFTVRLRKRYPALTLDDMYYCCLYLIGLNEADISALMQRAYSTVCERNRKIKRVLEVQGDLSAALQDLIFNIS